MSAQPQSVAGRPRPTGIARLAHHLARVTGRVRMLIAGGWTLLLVLLLWMPPTPPGLGFPGLDKIIHASLFLAFAVLWRWSGQTANRILILALMLALVTELVQSMLPWPRSPEVLDGVADLCGAVIGLAITFVALRRWPVDTSVAS